MQRHASQILPALCLLASTLVGQSSAYADEPAPSLYEKRLGIIKGTAKGIVLWGGDKPEPTASANASQAAPGNNKAAAGTESKPPTTTAHAETPSLLSTVSPPSGRSLNDARRLGAVGGGITLPTKATQADPTAKP